MPKQSPRKILTNGGPPPEDAVLGTQPARLKSFTFELRPAADNKTVTVAIAIFELLNMKGELCGQMTFLTDSDEIVQRLNLRHNYSITLAHARRVEVPA